MSKELRKKEIEKKISDLRRQASSIILGVYIDNLLPSTYQLTALPTTETPTVLDAHMDNPQYDIYLYSPTSGCRNTYRYGCPWFTFQLPVAGTKKVTT
ncbi:unnamed protein product, partial [Iphiclides podalirius]